MKEEKETVYDEAIETAKDIEVVENVMIQTATTQLSFSSLMFGLERGDYVIPDFQRMYHWTEEQAEQLAILWFGECRFRLFMVTEMQNSRWLF